MSERLTIHCCDVLEGLGRLPDASVHCCVTSPPYWGLRSYGCDGQIGLEPTPGEHIARLLEVFREVRRVLRPDGTLWLNYGDCYACAPNGRSAADTRAAGGDDRTFRDKPFSTVTRKGKDRDPKRGAAADDQVLHHARRKFNVAGGAQIGGRSRYSDACLKPKDLVGMPWRVAFALQEDGWWLRSDVIWHKPNPMPESVPDRPTSAHEHVFLLAKQERYYYDAQAVKEPGSTTRLELLAFGERPALGFPGHMNDRRRAKKGASCLQDALGKRQYEGFNGRYDAAPVATRNLRNVWTIATEPYRDAHFATFPTALVKSCVLAGTSERGCCPACGAPWVRVVEVHDHAGVLGNGWHDHIDDAALGQRMSVSAAQAPHRSTAGWKPSCICGHADTISATVLDPFLGAGTTALVALQLGRHAVGVELNEQYVEMARRRLAPVLAQGTLELA